MSNKTCSLCKASKPVTNRAGKPEFEISACRKCSAEVLRILRKDPMATLPMKYFTSGEQAARFEAERKEALQYA